MVILQSSYVPWRGYFDLIRKSDKFIFYDEVLYSKGDWRNRNLIGTPYGAKWLTVPVKYGHLGTKIEDKLIQNEVPWQRKHWSVIWENYRKASFWKELEELLGEVYLEHDWEHLSTLNKYLLKKISAFLGYEPQFLDSTELEVQGGKTSKLVEICRHLGATSYLSGPSAKQYLEEELFDRNGIELIYMTYDYQPYPSCYPDIRDNLSIIDLIASVGKDAPLYLGKARK